MEGSPFKAEDDSGSQKPESPVKKKKAESLGSFLAEPKLEAKSELADDSKNFLEKLFKGDDQPNEVETEAGGAETELPIDETTPAEEQVIAEHLIAAQPELVAETQEPEAIEEAEAVEAFRDKIVTEHKDAETALAETLDELDLEHEPEATQALVPIMETVPTETAAELPIDKPEERTIHIPKAMETEPEAEEDEKPAVLAGNDQPPLPPVRPVAGGANFGPTGGNYHPNVLVASAAAGEAIRRPEYVLVNNESDVLGATLLGGIVGYLLGRRRGRITAEKRMRPVQKKLERRVGELQQDLIDKETRIRRVVRQQSRHNERVKRLELSDRRLNQRTQKLEAVSRRGVAPEANRLHSTTVLPELLGKVIIGAEARAATPLTRTERPLIATVSRRIENLTHDELLVTSQNIPVEQSNLSQIYETHLVSEQGLRRLVQTHEQGGDLKRALRHEIMEHDIDFERDPIFRDRPKAPVATSSATASVSALVARVTADDQVQNETAILKSRAAYETAQQHREQSRRQMVDIGLVGTILILAVSVIVLILSRG